MPGMPCACIRAWVWSRRRLPCVVCRSTTCRLRWRQHPTASRSAATRSPCTYLQTRRRTGYRGDARSVRRCERCGRLCVVAAAWAPTTVCRCTASLTPPVRDAGWPGHSLWFVVLFPTSCSGDQRVGQHLWSEDVRVLLHFWKQPRSP